MTALLHVQNLCKAYPGFTLTNVSFTLRPGRIMGLIGKNGAGKSTTLKSLLNIVRPDSGAVYMFGRDFYAEERDLKQQTGVVFGGIDSYPLKQLSAVTAVTRRFYDGWEPARYKSYLRQFGIDERKKLRDLSNGMKVKYLLALALSHQARLLILDEPTSGLDPVSRGELLQIFQSIVADGTRSILFSTHITSDLDRCADDITYIQNGRVLASAEKSVFLQSFNHLRTPEDTAPLNLEAIMLRSEPATAFTTMP